MATSHDRLPLRVMVDANILIAGLGWPRFPYEVLQHALAGDYQLVLSPLVIAQARAHLQRILPDVLPKFEEFLVLSDYEEVADPTPQAVAVHAGLVRDPGDVPVALAAVHARLDCLVTQDRDFTDADNAELRRQLTIRLPAVFLRDYMGWSSEALEAIRLRTWDQL